MSPDGIIEPVDVSGDGVVSLFPALPGDRPDQFRLDGLEDGLDHPVVVAVPLAAHRDQDAAFSERGPIIDRAVLRTTTGMMDQPRRRFAVYDGAPRSHDCDAALQPVTRRPAGDPPRVGVNGHREIEPTLRRPDAGNVSALFPIRLLGPGVMGDQVGGSRPNMLAVHRPLEPPFLPCHEAILAH